METGLLMVDIFPPTDSVKNAVDMFPRTDWLERHSFCPFKPCGSDYENYIKDEFQISFGRGFICVLIH